MEPYRVRVTLVDVRHMARYVRHMPNSPRVSAAFPAVIRAKMAELNLSENSLAEGSAMTATTLRRRLKKPGDFTTDELEAVAVRLGLDITSFVTAAATAESAA